MPSFVDERTGLHLVGGRLNDLSLSLDGAGPLLPAQRAEFADVAGPGMGAVIARTGWIPSGNYVRVNALSREGHVVASAWASPVKTTEGVVGINLSFATHPIARGQGLAPLLATLAAAECLALRAGTFAPAPEFVNIQTRAMNAAARAVCARLGMLKSDAAGFQVLSRGGPAVDYVGYREPIAQFWDRATRPARARVPAYLPGDLAPQRPSGEGFLSRLHSHAAGAGRSAVEAREIDEPAEALAAPRG